MIKTRYILIVNTFVPILTLRYILIEVKNMRLSAKAIINYSNINSYKFGNQWTVRSGDANTLYFQLVDLDQDGIRYLPGLSDEDAPTLVVTFPSIDDDAVIALDAAMEANDRSIWSIAIPADSSPSSGNVRFALTADGVTRRFSVLNLMSVENPLNDGSC